MASETKPPPFRRKIVLVDPRFQLKYAVLLAAVTTTITGLCGFLAFVAHDAALDERFVPPEILLAMAGVRVDLIWMLVSLAVLVGGASFLVTMFLTHRIAGPIFMMTRYLSAIVNGGFPAIRPVRRNDELKDFFDLFHRSVEYLRAREVADAFKLEQVIEALAPVATTESAKEALATLRALHDQKRALATRAVPVSELQHSVDVPSTSRALPSAAP
jgi:hypothetical protein